MNIECENSILDSVPISEKRNGANNATEILLMSEYVASRVMEPPRMPVITGAAVAVGQKMHINAPWAMSSLNGFIKMNAAIAPRIWTDSRIQINFDIWKSFGETLQNVISNIRKIKQGDKPATKFM